MFESGFEVYINLNCITIKIGIAALVMTTKEIIGY